MLELVMEPTNKPRVSDEATHTPEVQAEAGRTHTPAQNQAEKLNILMSRLAANAAAMGDSYWKRSPKG